MKTFGSKVVSAVNVSPKGWQNVGWATLLTAVGAGVTYLAGHLGDIDMQKLGQYGPMVMTLVVPMLSYIKNKIQEVLKEKNAKEEEENEPKPPPKPKALDFNLIGAGPHKK